MSTTTSAAERRLLSDDEFTTVQQTHHPAVGELDDQELGKLVKLLRTWREKFTTLARQQRREMRGKSAPRGARPAGDNRNTMLKKKVFIDAEKRVKKEIERRRAAAARLRQVESSRRALSMRRAAEAERKRPSSGRTASKGMRAKGSTKRDQFPDTDANKGRLSAQVKGGQARRDSRG